MFRANDVKALIARRVSRGMLPDDVLAGMSTPALFYAGTEDPGHAFAERAADLMPNATLVSLEGLDHVGAAAPSVTGARASADPGVPREGRRYPRGDLRALDNA